MENTKWLQYISGLLKSAVIVVNTIDKECKPVLVHCSDGWDRTPQIVALAELMLDPFYRTMEVRQLFRCFLFNVCLVLNTSVSREFPKYFLSTLVALCVLASRVKGQVSVMALMVLK